MSLDWTAGEWSELVTTALLGTDRRPVAAADPAASVLDAAARHRAIAAAGSRLPVCAAPHRPAVDLARLVPPEATAVLLRLLEEGSPALIMQWLWAADVRGLQVHPDAWTGLAGLALRSPELERRLLRTVLGQAGRWFLRQNPQWGRLAAAIDAPSPPKTGNAASVDTAPRLIESDDVLASPELIFELRTSWTRDHTEAALRAIGDGTLGWRVRGYAAALGARMPLDHADLLEEVARAFADEPGGPPGGRRLAEEAYAACGRSMALRLEIARAFESVPIPVDDPQESSR